MSARREVVSAGIFQSPDLAQAAELEAGIEFESPQAGRAWSPENFAREQIQGLVQKVFFAGADRPVRQVVFSAVEAETDVRSLCRRVGYALAAETLSTVAVMGGGPRLLQDAQMRQEQMAEEEMRPGSIPPLRRIATRVRGNLWLVPGAGKTGDRGTIAALCSYLGELRREFEFSIVEGPAAGESSETTAMAQFADGIVLVLSAHRTRRVAARKIKVALEEARARLLGTVLSDRVFAIPEGIYQRL